MTIRKPRASGAIIPDVENWLTPEEFEREFPKIASANAIRRDVWRRRELGLETIAAVHKVGKRVLIHRHRYAAWRLGELIPPASSKPPKSRP